uniref:Uncharacterized protein n=1 Tax=Chelonoidis abingdonii TaxID=106734 RepID=A0A8C0GPM1_CHEAB
MASSSTEKFTIVGMKFSLIMMERICFQSVVLSPNSRQMDSSASFTAAGGLAIERTSTRCCFFIDFTANHSGHARWSGKKGTSSFPSSTNSNEKQVTLRLAEDSERDWYFK